MISRSDTASKVLAVPILLITNTLGTLYVEDFFDVSTQVEMKLSNRNNQVGGHFMFKRAVFFTTFFFISSSFNLVSIMFYLFLHAILSE